MRDGRLPRTHQLHEVGPHHRRPAVHAERVAKIGVRRGRGHGQHGMAWGPLLEIVINFVACDKNFIA